MKTPTCYIAYPLLIFKILLPPPLTPTSITLLPFLLPFFFGCLCDDATSNVFIYLFYLSYRPALLKYLSHLSALAQDVTCCVLYATMCNVH